MCLFEYESFQKGQQHGTHFGGDWVDPVLSRDAAVVGAASLLGSGAAGGAGGPWMERHGAAQCWASTGGGLGGGGDGEREVARRGRRRRAEGGSDEGEAATRVR